MIGTFLARNRHVGVLFVVTVIVRLWPRWNEGGVRGPQTKTGREAVRGLIVAFVMVSLQV